MLDGKSVRVGIVVADPLRALGLQSILQEVAMLDVVVCDLATALIDTKLEALLLDDHLESGDVVPLVTRFRRERPEVTLLVLGEAPDFQYIERIIGAGARGYLLETTSEAELRMAVNVVLDGSVWAPRKVLARLLDTGVARPKGDAPGRPAVLELLTTREREVLELLIDGGSNREIGRRLGIDEVTVKAHLGRMLRKTQSKNRVELTLRALEERAVQRETDLADDSGT